MTACLIYYLAIIASLPAVFSFCRQKESHFWVLIDHFWGSHSPILSFPSCRQMHPWHPLTRDQWDTPPLNPPLASAGSTVSLALPFCNIHADIKSITGSFRQSYPRGTFPHVTCMHATTPFSVTFWIPFVNKNASLTSTHKGPMGHSSVWKTD